jgi:hypothetical protein
MIKEQVITTLEHYFNVNRKDIVSGKIPVDVFEFNFRVIKVFCLILLASMTILIWRQEADKGLIVSSPVEFEKELLVVGLCSVVPYWVSVILRRSSHSMKDVLLNSIVYLLSGMVLHYLLEMTGFYNLVFGPEEVIEQLTTDKKTTREETFWNNFSTVSKWIVLGIISIAFLLMLFCVVIHQNNNPNYRFSVLNRNKWTTLFFELVVNASISASTIYYICKHRNNTEGMNRKFVINVSIFVFLQILFQFSGYYSKLYE